MTDTPLLEWRSNSQPDEDKTKIRWAECKRKNPFLLEKCYQLCLRAKQRGITRWSADAVFHVLRWETSVSTGGDLGLKIDNSYTSLAARDLMAEYPDLKGFFQIKPRKPRGNYGHIH